MSDTATRARRRTKDRASSAEDDVRDEVSNGTDELSSKGNTISSELMDTFREAAIEVLKPVMRKATTSAAKYAVKEGPSLVKDKIAPKLEDVGGAAGLAKSVASKGGGVTGAVGGIASKLTGKGGGEKGPGGTGRGRRLPVEEHVDIGVDLQTAYDQFTQFEDWPKFMHRVERIEQRDDTTLMWHENIWGVRRSWEAEIIKQIPCERLVWRSKNGPKTIGVVTFHRLSDNLTRVMITMDYQPQGLFEKTSSGTRISRRALVSDLMRFKAFIELRDEATGGWEGRIEDGEVSDDERAEDEDEPRASEEEEDFEDEEEGEEPEAEEDEEPEAEEDEEPEAEEDEDFEEPEDEGDEEEEEEEEEQAPRSRSNGRRRRKVAEEDLEEAPKPRRRRRTAEATPKAKPRRRRSPTKS